MENQSKKRKLKILVSPDKFRGSLNASQVCEAVQQGLKQAQRQILGDNEQSQVQVEVQKLQLADGGQGSLQVLQKNMPHLCRVQLVASDPLFRPIKTYYLVDEQNSVAYIEMAKVSGLSLLEQTQRNPLHTSTFGVGQIIKDALSKSISKIYLFIGGSATNDAGIGMANALGYKFLSHQDQLLLPIGKSLQQINKILQPQEQIMQQIVKTDIYVVTDTQNVFYGKQGASFVYAPQKGANQKQVQELDKGLFNINEVFIKQLTKDLSLQKGSGAAGGLGGGAIIFLKAKIQKGIKKIMQILNFSQKACQSSLIITGEGKLDKQSLQGKVVYGVIKQAKKFNKPLWIICGINQLNEQSDLWPIYDDISVISLVDKQKPQQIALKQARELIKSKIKQKFFSFQKNQKDSK